MQVIKFLLTINRHVDVNVVNVDGSTALDVSKEILDESDHSKIDESNHWKIKAILKKFKAVKARKISSTWPKKEVKKTQNEKYKIWLTKMKESLLVVGTLMATIMFQVTLNPPGGVWQQNEYYKSNSNYTNPPGGVWQQNECNNSNLNDTNYSYITEEIRYEAGRAIISYTLPRLYKVFTICTALGLLSSVSLILLLVSGFSFQQRKISIWILIVTTWISGASIMMTYFISHFTLMRHGLMGEGKFWLVVPGVIVVWLLLMCLVFSVHIYRLVRRISMHQA